MPHSKFEKDKTVTQILEKSGLRFSMKAPKASRAAGSVSMRLKL
jgi:hypothetical protein